jgi:hypothetical protein
MPIAATALLRRTHQPPPSYTVLESILLKCKHDMFMSNNELATASGFRPSRLDWFAVLSKGRFHCCVREAASRRRYWGRPESVAKLKDRLREGND